MSDIDELALKAAEKIGERSGRTGAYIVGEFAKIIKRAMEQYHRKQMQEWATLLCSRHRIPDPKCSICNDAINDARQQERKRCAAICNELAHKASKLGNHTSSLACGTCAHKIKEGDNED